MLKLVSLNGPLGTCGKWAVCFKQMRPCPLPVGRLAIGLPDFKAMEITALETAMDNKAYLKEGLLNAAIWYESELVSLNSQSVKAVFVDTSNT
jgi:hypothetical protein